ncbi:hypothetical protein IQ279_02960 [Streptomyces verrucosisporus]|uniref:hypothetical protein n=1 Tax=Streptomyces verrucosisporus TaxID=1695161 RepID=UPI0019D03440|nr:hypothetical protein [Streptomyces verrucosisporus]MBN3928616.1 hypothetical protein [Streptomyces verrucosisporus]
MPEKTADEAANRTADLRKALTDPTPLYFAAGVIDKIRETAPERLAAVKDKAADHKAVQERLAEQAKQTQSRLTTALSGLDTDLKKLREQAQHLALQGVGLAAEYAVKAREGYGELAERGRGAVGTWRGEKNGGEKTGAGAGHGLPVKSARKVGEAVTVEAGGKEEKPRPKMGDTRRATPGRASATRTTASKSAAPKKTASRAGAARKAAAGETPKTVAKKSAARKTAAKQSSSQKAASPSDKLPADKPQE